MEPTKKNHTKWQRTYEDDYAFYIWKYNSKISWINPVEVEIKYKSNEDPFGKKVKRTKVK